ncbi:hypothetical protein [Streptomyces sp. B93]|uniref:hypothetical protein n=1 Tax=Streptomyces sp. B93 TaxID=2824875 RepID=UPI001B36C247|nr:hypothetical protein [Streptomyces sp. B93]MBQ1088841.1 hypothetical protein [Streptomyces sp. B93]
MRTFVEAATGLPTLLFTTALVVVACFWLLVGLRLTTVDTFDADADLRAWGLGGVPVAVAFSLLTAIAWGLAVGTTLLLADFVPAGAAAGLLRLATPAGALLVAWRTTRLLVRLSRRHFPEERDPELPARPVSDGGVTGGPGADGARRTGGEIARRTGDAAAYRPVDGTDRRTDDASAPRPGGGTARRRGEGTGNRLGDGTARGTGGVSAPRTGDVPAPGRGDVPAPGRGDVPAPRTGGGTAPRTGGGTGQRSGDTAAYRTAPAPAPAPPAPRPAAHGHRRAA